MPREGAVSPLFAGGFGAQGEGGRTAVDAPGSAEAKIALKSSGGDLNRATSMVFQRRLERLQEGNEELGAMLREASAAGRTSPAATVENPEVHEALVSATWDAVATMNALPKSRKTSAEERDEKRVAKRLKTIAEAARTPPGGSAAEGDPAHASSAAVDGGDLQQEEAAGPAAATTPPTSSGKILDIGCGDGALMPYLLGEDHEKNEKKQAKARKNAAKRGRQKKPPPRIEAEASPKAALMGVEETGVTGVDLSEVMISAAQQRYPNARWLTGNALALPALLGKDRPEPLFSSIVFNGSLQFFRDPPGALTAASAWLLDGGHIVVAHVQGSDFVKDECRRNPRVAPSPMPGREVMEEWAQKAGCVLLEGADDLTQRDFLLQVMKKL